MPNRIEEKEVNKKAPLKRGLKRKNWNFYFINIIFLLVVKSGVLIV